MAEQGQDGWVDAGAPGSAVHMPDRRPETDEKNDPAGTPSPGPDNLTSKPVTPGADDAGQATAVPGVYEADEEERARGKASKPGN